MFDGYLLQNPLLVTQSPIIMCQPFPPHSSSGHLQEIVKQVLWIVMIKKYLSVELFVYVMTARRPTNN